MHPSHTTGQDALNVHLKCPTWLQETLKPAKLLMFHLSPDLLFPNDRRVKVQGYEEFLLAEHCRNCYIPVNPYSLLLYQYETVFHYGGGGGGGGERDMAILENG